MLAESIITRWRECGYGGSVCECSSNRSWFGKLFEFVYAVSFPIQALSLLPNHFSYWACGPLFKNPFQSAASEKRKSTLQWRHIIKHQFFSVWKRWSYGSVGRKELIIIGTPTKSFIDRDHKITYYEDGEVQDFYTFPQDQKTISIIELVGWRNQINRWRLCELQKGDQSVIFLGKNTFGDYGIMNRSLGKYSLNHPEVSISRMSEESTRQSEEDETDKYKNYREEVFKKYNIE